MKKQYKLLTIICVILLLTAVGFLAGCGKTDSSQDTNAQENNTQGSNTNDTQTQEPITIKVAHVQTPASIYGSTIQSFLDLVTQKTNGKVKFENFHSGQLGGERDILENVTNGTIPMTVVSSAMLGTVNKEMSVIDTPYLWKSYDHIKKVLDPEGDVRKQIDSSLETINHIKAVGWISSEPRIVWSSKPIRTLKDFKGFKVRSPEVENYVLAFKAMGANPTPIPWPEAYSAVQTKVVDGADTTLDAGKATSFYEVAKYAILTNHIWGTAVFAMNIDEWNKLPSDIQQAFLEAGIETEQDMYSKLKTLTEDDIKWLTENGIEIIDLDRGPFKEAVKPVWVELGAKNGTTDLIQKIDSQE